MNGRMYDPAIGMMLAPDINIPDPYSAAGYNRYEYAMNNPLSNVDPSGWLSEAAIQDIFNELNNSDPYGASYTSGETPGGGSGGSWTSFGSDAGTFDAGVAYATEFGLWGKNGVAPSFAYAQGAYYLQYNGRDPGVAALLPPIVLVGKIVNDQWQTSHVFYPGQYTEDKNGVITVQWGGKQHGVGAPGFWEGAIPVWGNTRNAVNDFQTGHWGWGLFHSAMAISDVFLVKSIFTGIAKLGVEAAVDASVNEASTTVYRAVDATEAASINNSGQFLLDNAQMDGKYFANSLEDAQWYGSKIYGEGNFSIFQGNVNGSINQFWHPNIDIGAYYIPGENLPSITPLNYVHLP